MTCKRNGTIWLLLVAIGLLFTPTAHATSVGTLEALKTALSNDTNIKLTANITTAESLTVNRAITLDLSGYGILMTGDYSAIRIGSSGDLTLSDSNSNTTHYLTISDGRATGIAESQSDSTTQIKGGFIAGGKTSDGGGVYVDKGNFAITGGTVYGNIADSNGGGVYVTGGTFTMNGGTISGNASKYSYSEHGGGGVFINSGTFTMTGGTISGNNAKSEGSGVFINGGMFTMTGGTISRNTPGFMYIDGGGVYVSGGTFDMTGGLISENDVGIGSGGGVFCYYEAIFIMRGGTISGNNAKRGGGVYVVNGATFTMTGGTISGNTVFFDAIYTGGCGGGVYLADKFTMAGGTISGNTSAQGGGVYVTSAGSFDMTGGTISGNNVSSDGGIDPMGGGVYVQTLDGKSMYGNTNTNIYYGKFNISGDVNITGNFKGATKNSKGTFSGGLLNNVYMLYLDTATKNPIAIKGALNDNTKIGITMISPDVFTSGLKDNGTISNFTSDNYNYNIMLSGDEAALTGHTHIFAFELSDDDTTDDRTTVIATCSAEDCPLPNSKATLSIGAPVSDDGKAILTCTPDGFGSFFDISTLADSITYWTKSDGYEFDSSTDIPPTEQGFYKATVTYKAPDDEEFNLYVTYGLNCISYDNTADSHGTVSGPTTAAVSVVVTPEISSDTGYELDTLSVMVDDDWELDTIDNKSFIMPDGYDVTVSATFKQKDYEISSVITSGSVTATPSTAHCGDTVRLVISPDVGCGIMSINSNVTLNLISKDTDSGVEIYEFTMPADDVNVTVELAETIIYTIFYRLDNTSGTIYYRFYDSDDTGFKMRADAKANDITCWAGQMKGAEGKDSFTISFNSNGSWESKTCEVKDISELTNIDNGTVILVPGDENAFIAAFTQELYILNEIGAPIGIRSNDWGVSYYFVTKNTTSIEVENPTKTGYDFMGWSYQTGRYSESNVIEAGSGSTTIAIKGSITETTTFKPIWKRQTPIVTYDLMGGTWSRSNSDTVAYGNTLAEPSEKPTRDGYAFSRWVVKSEANAMMGDDMNIRLYAGCRFDFNNTRITENTRLKAIWKHVHSYTYVPLSQANDYIPGLVSEAIAAAYAPYLHFKICKTLDDYNFENHEYGKDGKCVCGAEKQTPNVTLEITYNNRDQAKPMKSTYKQNSMVRVTAPPIGGKNFVKWEYRSLNGTEWRDLTTCPVTGFAIPGSVRINAVYESKTEPELNLQAEHYGDGLLFRMNYALPSGCVAKRAAILYADNYLMGYKTIERRLIPEPDPMAAYGVFGKVVKKTAKVFGDFVTHPGKALDIAMDTLGIENKYLRGAISLGVAIAMGDPVGIAQQAASLVVDDMLDTLGLGDTVVGDIIDIGMSVATGEPDAIQDVVMTGAGMAADLMKKEGTTATNDDRYYIAYVGREDNILEDSSYKDVLAYLMLTGQCVTMPGPNDVRLKEAQSLGKLNGMAYTCYLGIKDVYEGNRYFYVMGFVEYENKNDNTYNQVIIGPTYCTYNTTKTTYTYTESPINLMSYKLKK